MNICTLIDDVSTYFGEAFSFAYVSLTGTFGISMIGAFSGAVGGAFAINLIEQRRESRKLLSNINASSAMLVGHINTLLSMKKQMFLPLADEIKSTDEVVAKAKEEKSKIDITHIRLMTQLFPDIDTDFLFPLDIVSEYAHISTRPIEFALRGKEALLSVSKRIHDRNVIIDDLRLDPREAGEKLPEYLGLKTDSNKTDLRLRHLSDALINDADAALWFMVKTQESLQYLGKKSLPKKMQKRLAKFEFSKGFGSLLPPKDFLEWEN